jgi:hypothetical protein
MPLQGVAVAQPPLQEWRDLTATHVLLMGATARCGFDIFADAEGRSHYIVFYDNAGAIVSEVDVFPALKITVYAPSTGKSYTTVSPAVLHTYYTEGARIGSVATGELTGLLEKVDDIQMDSGRLVFLSHVVGYDGAGVPLIGGAPTVISSVGPNLDTPPIGQARCNAMKA